MKQIIYIIAITLLVIAAPIAALALSVYTFFITIIAFVQGSHQGIMSNLYDQNKKEIEEEPQDIWEKHIKKMTDKAKLN